MKPRGTMEKSQMTFSLPLLRYRVVTGIRLEHSDHIELDRPAKNNFFSFFTPCFDCASEIGFRDEGVCEKCESFFRRCRQFQ